MRDANATNSGAGTAASEVPCGAVDGAGRGVAGASVEGVRGAVGAAVGALEVAWRGALGGVGTLLSWGCAARAGGAPSFILAASGAVRTSPRVAPNTDKSITKGATHASAAGTPRAAVKSWMPNALHPNAPQVTPHTTAESSLSERSEPSILERVGSPWTLNIRSVGGAAAQAIARAWAVPGGTVSQACPTFPATERRVLMVSQHHRNLRSARRVRSVAWRSAASTSRRVT
ncbi:Uncharacterised protein [Mycobacteroides abscessus subsp. abscessus]|nr:Uncharacterised protein [Mycobacteroides abscessus subsp. abscessus]